MSQLPNTTPDAMDTQSAAHMVHMATRFLRVVRYRLNVLIVVVVIAGALGALYYGTATRVYQAAASLLILHTGPDFTATGMTPDTAAQGLMPTYERLFSSAVVLKGAVQRLTQLPAEYRVDFGESPADKWPDVLRERLSAKSLRRTNIIVVSYRSQSPDAAVEVVNAVVESYLEFMEKNHKNVAAEVVAILQHERQQVEQQLSAREDELLQAKLASGELAIDNSSEIVPPVISNVVRLNDELLQTRLKRVELEASLEAIRMAAASGGNVRQHLLAIDADFGREMLRASLGMNPQDLAMMSQWKQDLLDKQLELQRLSEFLGPNNADIVTLNQSILMIRRRLDDFNAQVEQRLADSSDDKLAPMLIGMVQEELAKIWQHEQRLQTQHDAEKAKADALTGDVARISMLEHNVRVLRNLYATLGERISTIDISDEQSDVRVAVVSEPKRNENAVSPKLTIIGLLCLILGVGGGCAVVYVLDVLDDRFRSPEEMREQLGVPVLAMIRQLQTRDGVGADTLPVHVASDTVESEAFRTLRTTLAFTGSDISRLVVSSAEPGDGKTTVLANLAASYAAAGRKTLIIDADMRRPGLTRLFDLRAAGGLSDVLRSQESLPEVCAERILNTGVEGLDILPCGPRPTDPSELLSGPRLGDLIAWAETVYDQILIDSPPALAASDAALVGRQVDGLILVVHPDKNHRRGVIRAVESLQSLGIQLIGTVVNRVGADKDRGYYGHDSGYGYGYGYSYDYAGAEDEQADTAEASDAILLDAQGPREEDDDGHVTPRRVA